MTIYTDGVHLISDPKDNIALHAFASRIGLKRCWFQGDHYDITTRMKAIRACHDGAILIEMKDIARLRMRQRGNMIVPDDWAPKTLPGAYAGDQNTRILKIFAPGRVLGKRGHDHIVRKSPRVVANGLFQ